MKHILPRLTVLAMLAAATAAAAQGQSPLSPVPGPLSASQGPRTGDQGPGTAGDRLLLQTLAQLERRQSVTARLLYEIFLDGRQLKGNGSYWQQGSGDDLRVRLELRINTQKSSLLQVSNSRFLWTDQRLPSGRVVTRIDLRKLRADPALAPAQLEEIQPGHATWSPIEPESTTICGGLPTLLSSLVEHFAFAPPQATVLEISPPLVAEPTRIPVFVVVGHWRPEKLAQLRPAPPEGQDAAADPQGQPLPERFPQEVLLLVGQADLFPYRIEYRRLESQPQEPGTASATRYELSAKPTVVMALTDVAFDVPIAAGQFDYAPGDADWADRTAECRERLKKRRLEQVATHNGTAVEPISR
jgi:hypothetical protein